MYDTSTKVQRVYIDTSVIGGCFDIEFALCQRRLRAVVSEIVAAELENAPAPVRDRYITLLTHEVATFTVSPEALALADLYQQKGILTPKYYDDGLHIARTTVAEVDVLVSWNFKDIVHYDKIRRFNAMNVEHGYKPLAIYSPREVTGYNEDTDRCSCYGSCHSGHTTNCLKTKPLRSGLLFTVRKRSNSTLTFLQ